MKMIIVHLFLKLTLILILYNKISPHMASSCKQHFEENKHFY